MLVFIKNIRTLHKLKNNIKKADAKKDMNAIFKEVSSVKSCVDHSFIDTGTDSVDMTPYLK